MNKALIYAVFLSSLYLMVGSQDMSECDVWTNVMNSMTQISQPSHLNVNCNHNPICTGFDCTRYYAGFISITFGAAFIPCHQPVQLRVYMMVMEQETARVVDLTPSPQLVAMPLPGSLASAQLNGSVHIIIQLVSANNFSFQMNASLLIPGRTVNAVLVPQQFIRVPQCTGGTTMTPGTTTKALPTPAADLSSTGKSCRPGSLGVCGNNQMCSIDHCICIHEMVYDKSTDQCQAWTPSTTDSSSAIAGTGIIVMVICILAAVLFAGILSVIVIKYRRYRARYGQHEPLINNEGDDRDLEVDADPPMLQA
jgi:hypothetical protein